MADVNTYENYYFIGIGGIGMSTLARYFHSVGKRWRVMIRRIPSLRMPFRQKE